MRTISRKVTVFLLVALAVEMTAPAVAPSAYAKELTEKGIVFEIKPKSGPLVKYPQPFVPKVVVVAPAPKPVAKKVVKAVKKVKPQTSTVAVTGKTMTVTMTAYSSTPDQTDGNPFITASGSHVHWGTVAANFLPFGTKIRIPDYFGNQVFTVEDRTARKYNQRVDVWFPTRGEAIQFGKRTLRIEIL